MATVEVTPAVTTFPATEKISELVKPQQTNIAPKTEALATEETKCDDVATPEEPAVAEVAIVKESEDVAVTAEVARENADVKAEVEVADEVAKEGDDVDADLAVAEEVVKAAGDVARNEEVVKENEDVAAGEDEKRTEMVEEATTEITVEKN